MPAVKSAQEAIEDFVEAIAQHYVASKQSSDTVGVAEGVANDFLTAIEQDLRATLRNRLSLLDSVKEVEETPATDVTQQNGPSPSGDAPEHADQGTRDTGVIPDDSTVKPVRRSGTNAATLKDSVDFSGNGDVATLHTSKRSQGGSSSIASPASVPPGYEVVSVLGEGGMGIVYKAKHVPLNRMVAIKMILSGENATREQLRRFQIEAEAAAHLSHPNIVSVYEVGEHQGLPYFSQEFVDGQSMSQLMRETTMSAEDAGRMLIPVARAIDYSHEMGVLHRDLKPQNILVAADGTPKVADFGLAKRLDADPEGDKTRAGVILGTPGYMAPEQARSHDDVAPQADVYALGCILYYAMTGRPPFVGPTPFETVRQLLMSDPVAPSKLQPNLDRDLETICLKALEKDVNRRYATAGEFADELHRYLNNEPIVARPITRRERVTKWCRRNPRVAALTAIAASLLMCLLFGGLLSAFVINEQKKAEKIARQNAEASEKVADDQAELALDTTRMMLYEAKDFFNGKPELRPLREKMIESILDGVERIHAERYENDVQSTFVASAEVQLGQIYLDAGVFEKAKDKLLEAQQKLQVLNAEGKLRRADVSQMNITMALGSVHQSLGDFELAETEFLKLLKLRTKYFADHTDANFDPLTINASMAKVHGKLASVYKSRGKPQKSLDYMLKALKAHRAVYDAGPNNALAIAELASTLSSVSQLYELSGDTAKMVQASTESLELQSRLAESKSDTPTRHNLAMKQTATARQCLLIELIDDAKKLIDGSSGTYDELVDISDDQRIFSQAIEAYYWRGMILRKLNQDPSESFAKAESIQRKLIEKSDNISAQGRLLKILASSGKIDQALQLADGLAEKPETESNCGYALCGYSLMLDQLPSDDPRRDEITRKGVEMARGLIGHGYQDFNALRKTDIDFAGMQKQDAYQRMLDEEQARLAKND